ncbi:SGNH/GDSL hydrolase family protein [Nostoc sp. CENA67]|uniref:SGNH/GDSL hydrolase family protein n=1 Tax=Amazonocrinis nigriterrae CENA67 TaxID=2794033 RepID=A0A8J7HRU3_9NOST|nr:SGNH/GDSL hydrolase family protein [Amazonocrinis nigriterrae]MBH8562563.1 SGNH/GDSL hydrolase family protein [Amazonocrinis nigriterrae CENA67]
MKKQILATGFFLLSLMFPLKVSAQNYDEIYVFGDSFSDTGNFYHATKGAIPPSPTYFEGRFSNGPVWEEYLAQQLGLTVNLSNNFAFGGATTGLDNIGLPGLPGLQQQINSFTAENPSANPNALYIVWTGANDYFSYFLGGVPNFNKTVTNLSQAVTSLAQVGAQNIMVVNLPDLGLFPVTGGNSQISSYLSTLTNAHNSKLNTTLKLLSQQLRPEINIIPLNVNSLFNRVIAAPGEFSFTNVTDSCIGNSSVVPIDISTQPITCTPDKFLFWDEIHPTTATHKLIGELAFSALHLAHIPEPSTVLGVLSFGILGLYQFSMKMHSRRNAVPSKYRSSQTKTTAR